MKSEYAGIVNNANLSEFSAGMTGNMNTQSRPGSLFTFRCVWKQCTDLPQLIGGVMPPLVVSLIEVRREITHCSLIIARRLIRHCAVEQGLGPVRSQCQRR